ncbi:MAG TPA: Ppx/GppA phosphatase family protein [Negativicutes bacterium]|nr:Ppx/GppA phosphatase family protein [Negativicutes bacterium]
MTERIAIIDLGSNSARLIVMHIYANGAYNLVYHQKETVRLSEGMGKSRTLRPDAVKRAVETIRIFAYMCQLFKVDKILAVATAAVRSAKNGMTLVELVEAETGIRLDAITGHAEAHIGFIGVINTIDVDDAVIFDLGGGSTELTLIRGRVPQKVASLPFGAVNLTEQFATQDRISASQLDDFRGYIMRQLDKLPWLQDVELPLVGVGGTARNVAKMDQRRKNYPFNKVHNYRLGDISLTDLWRSLSLADYKQRLKFPGLSSERADIIVAGTTLVKCLFDVTGANRLIVSGCGLREGLFFKHYLARTGQPEVIADILLHSTHNMLLFYKGDAPHAYHVAALAEAMFVGWQDLHRLDDRDRKLLRVASLLHDIGITISYYDHARHSAYLVENARLFGLTHREQMLAAVVAGWHEGPTVKYMRNRIYSEFLDDTDWQKARKMALLLALAESLDTTQLGLVTEVAAGVKDKTASLTMSVGRQGASVEIQEAERYRKWFKKEFGVEIDLHITPATAPVATPV